MGALLSPTVASGTNKPSHGQTYQKHDQMASSEGAGTREAQARLLRLEEMVSRLIRQPKGDHDPAFRRSHANDVMSPSETLGDMDLRHDRQLHVIEEHNGSMKYLGPTHWTAVLEDLRDIQGVLAARQGNKEQSPAPEVPKPYDFDVFGTATNCPRLGDTNDIYAAIPPKPMVDKLLSVYFNTKHQALAMMHEAKFQREYDAFWRDPKSASLLWISVLLSALYQGASITQASEMKALEGPVSRENQMYLSMAGKALLLGNCHKAQPYCVEALVLFATCKYWAQDDSGTEPWMIMGMSARLAMKMGYHRDPRHFGTKISPFEGEMRRRTWFSVSCFELLLSFQAGLPSSIRDDECDTGPPSNLVDSDFDENCEELPPSRPMTDHTPMLYYICKSELSKVFRKVAQHVLSPATKPYMKTMELDGLLHQNYETIPPSLRYRPMASSFTDPSNLIINRINSELIHLKCVCVLHRNYLTYDRTNSDYEYSRRACLDAARQLLAIQAEMHEACQPHGQLSNEKWLVSNLALHDFLLAAMIICLNVHEVQTRPISNTMSAEDKNILWEQYGLLERSRNIWMSRRPFSKDARKASDVLALMLTRVFSSDIMAGQNLTTGPIIPTESPNTDFCSRDTIIMSPMEPGYDTNPTSHAGMIEESNGLASDNFADESLMTFLTESEGIDWTYVDQCLLGHAGPGKDAALTWQLLDNLGVSTNT
ncbi:hypothetical protein MMC25_005668 [Agyrium rufum]|nr:hypothetical protein [Agyrium rufum]